MPKSHVPYPPEFRQQMIELVRAGRNPHEVAKEFECSAQTIRNWVAQSAVDSGKPLPGKEGLTSAERDELARLRRQVKQLQMERDILAKATAWFAGKNGGHPRPLRTRSREPGRLSSSSDVSSVADLSERLLRVAGAAAVGTRY